MSDRPLAILFYHRVLPSTDPLFPDETTAQVFTRHVAALARFFNVLPLDMAVARLANGTLPPRAACVTFDDGYRDNYSIALPILRRYGMPATFFIASGYVAESRPMWNDVVIEGVRNATAARLDLSQFDLGSFPLGSLQERRLAAESIIGASKYWPMVEREQLAAAVARLGAGAPATRLMMNVDEVRELHRAGMTIGAHTVTHPILSRVTVEEGAREIAAGREFLESVVNAPVSLFAYPNGRPGQDYEAAHVDLVRQAGFAAAVSTRPAMASRTSDPLQLPRLGIWDRTAPPFLARMLWRFMRPQTAA